MVGWAESSVRTEATAQTPASTRWRSRVGSSSEAAQSDDNGNRGKAFPDRAICRSTQKPMRKQSWIVVREVYVSPARRTPVPRTSPHPSRPADKPSQPHIPVKGRAPSLGSRGGCRSSDGWRGQQGARRRGVGLGDGNAPCSVVRADRTFVSWKASGGGGQHDRQATRAGRARGVRTTSLVLLEVQPSRPAGRAALEAPVENGRWPNGGARVRSRAGPGRRRRRRPGDLSLAARQQHLATRTGSLSGPSDGARPGTEPTGAARADELPKTARPLISPRNPLPSASSASSRTRCSTTSRSRTRVRPLRPWPSFDACRSDTSALLSRHQAASSSGRSPTRRRPPSSRRRPARRSTRSSATSSSRANPPSPASTPARPAPRRAVARSGRAEAGRWSGAGRTASASSSSYVEQRALPCARLPADVPDAHLAARLPTTACCSCLTSLCSSPRSRISSSRSTRRRSARLSTRSGRPRPRPARPLSRSSTARSRAGTRSGRSCSSASRASRAMRPAASRCVASAGFVKPCSQRHPSFGPGTADGARPAA
jgi:hypothetical protein